MTNLSRRDAVTALAAAAVAGRSAGAARDDGKLAAKPGLRFRIRTLTAGVQVSDLRDLASIESALAFLKSAKARAIAAGYEVQTTRIAMNPVLLGQSAQARDAALPQLVALDKLVSAAGAVASIGPVFATGVHDDQLARWSEEFVKATNTLSFSVAVATPDAGVHAPAVRLAAEITATLARALPGGFGNFRFAAAANIPAGTPFFPVGYHGGEPALSVGCETPNLVREAFVGAPDPSIARDRLRDLLSDEFAPLEKLCESLAAESRRRYLGIDSSPAPGTDNSIGAAIETLTGVPFGASGTLQACAAITEAIKSLRVKTCGYSGLMLPVLEDPVLAARASEGRFTIAELLLFSSVCGTGLDVVPIAGDASPDAVRRIIGDVATLATRLRKALSARLFPVPGKAAGDIATFDDPRLVATKVMPLS
jgi:uncharacterized protein